MQKSRVPRRTEQAELFLETFLSLPLIPEFVFRSPQAVKKTQKEVADLLIVHEGRSILVSLKCQEDPTVRNHNKTVAWARKSAMGAVAQLRGALRTVESRKPAWCMHPRRGRVDFPHGLPRIDHTIALVEVLEGIQLGADDLPLELNGTPITYLSLNDFLNVAIELRTVPEIFEYLDARRTLPDSDLRLLGAEKTLFSFYILNGGSLQGCNRRADAAALVTKSQDQLMQRLKTKSELDRYSGLLEQVAYELATRHSSYTSDLPPELLAAYDDPANRMNYLQMQGVLANLRLRERAELGRAFNGAIESLRDKESGFVYMAAYLDGQPNWVFVFGSSKQLGRTELLRRAMVLTRAALAHYRRPNCMLVVDRDGESYEVAITRADSDFSDEERAAGKQYFGHLKISDVLCTFSGAG